MATPRKEKPDETPGYWPTTKMAELFELTARRIQPVSYTHLDVYKRQLLCLTPKRLSEIILSAVTHGS